ncbi:hypothetical protein K5X82_07350 [Halosquirtibacter xylanolyticus]|uniref:hypothetical protein n=1 Tax=Halosquirtibacter xylanolyticus TaxID=3374599 RepID=UPI003748B9C6|nr:hypothetical protein K5X82_07350 [Prolixibacteraceae bacterium]
MEYKDEKKSLILSDKETIVIVGGGVILLVVIFKFAPELAKNFVLLLLGHFGGTRSNNKERKIP